MPVLVEYTITDLDRVGAVYLATKFCAPRSPVVVSVIETKVITVNGRRYVRRDLP